MRGKGKVFRSLLCAAMLSASLGAAGVSSANAVKPAGIRPAASTYTGGVIAEDGPLYVANDHTPVGFKFQAAGLEPSATYYMKVRFTVNASASGGSATTRGFTWNPTTGRWVQEREDWVNFPLVETDAAGTAVFANDTASWVYAKFGDENVSGPRYIHVSLSRTGADSTFNPSSAPLATVMDMDTDGFWVHNGIATGKQADKRVEVAPSGDTTPAISIARSEPNGRDDDGNGMVDDAAEDSGPAGTTGDFRFAVPTAQTMDVLFQRSYWRSILNAGAGCNVAVGAADQSPPSAPGAAVAQGGFDAVSLDWGAATDNTGVTSYNIYRWTDAPLAAQYTMPKILVGNVAGTEFDDAGLASDGRTYYYSVRAVDAAGNVGPAVTGASAVPYDDIDPAAVTDLAIDSVSPTSMTLSWTAPGDNGSSGTADSYALKYSTSPITDAAAFSAATTVTPVPDPSIAGTEESCEIEGLIPGVRYYFRLMAEDDAGNASDLSNVASAVASGLGEMKRLAGLNRAETAVAVSKATFASASTVVLATGSSFPDALAGAGLAGAVNGPVLLCGASLPSVVAAEIDRLGATRVLIVGGSSAVPKGVSDALIKAGKTVVRIGGANRYATAALVAKQMQDEGATLSDAFFVRGDNFPDALAVSPFAFANGIPVLLVRPDSVPAETLAAIRDRKITGGLAAGGTSAISAATFNALDAKLSGTFVRIPGASRYATAANTAAYGVSRGWGSFGVIGLATGADFPDALSGGAACGASGGVLLLTTPKSLSPEAAAQIRAHKYEIDRIDVFGGTAAIAKATHDAADALLP